MKLDELKALKARVAGAFNESPGGDLDRMLDDVGQSLRRTGFFTPPVAAKTGSRSHLIEARCAPVSRAIPSARIANEIERLWQDELRYDDFEAHALVVTDRSIILDFLTVARAPRLYVTGMIIVDLR